MLIAYRRRKKFLNASLCFSVRMFACSGFGCFVKKYETPRKPHGELLMISSSKNPNSRILQVWELWMCIFSGFRLSQSSNIETLSCASADRILGYLTKNPLLKLKGCKVSINRSPSISGSILGNGYSEKQTHWGSEAFAKVDSVSYRQMDPEYHSEHPGGVICLQKL